MQSAFAGATTFFFTERKYKGDSLLYGKMQATPF
jgi:hypothetical protein